LIPAADIASGVTALQQNTNRNSALLIRAGSLSLLRGLSSELPPVLRSTKQFQRSHTRAELIASDRRTVTSYTARDLLKHGQGYEASDTD